MAHKPPQNAISTGKEAWVVRNVTHRLRKVLDLVLQSQNNSTGTATENSVAALLGAMSCFLCSVRATAYSANVYCCKLMV